MRHLYRCPLRWGDMDMLGHVNNVTYLDYLQEARIDMFAVHAGFPGVGGLAEGVVVVRHEVEFLAPLVFRREPVLVEVWTTAVGTATFTLAYEVFDELAGERRVYLRASSVLAPYVFSGEHPRRLTAAERDVLGRFLEPAGARAPLGAPGPPRHVHPIRTRFSDVDIYRHVNNVMYFEYFQEARIQYVMDLAEEAGGWSDQVVARVDVDYHRPLLFRPEPYQVHSWISGLGRRSFTISARLRDPAGEGRELSAAEVVMVSFDRDTQRACDMPPEQRARLEQELSRSARRGC